MNAPIPIEVFARVVLPHGSRDAGLCMLTAHFDDSGTHDNSEVVVWAGLFGNEHQWKYFEELWRAKLAEPSPGKLPLSRFHMYDCQQLDGEFAGWNRTATDFLVHELGGIIL